MGGNLDFTFMQNYAKCKACSSHGCLVEMLGKAARDFSIRAPLKVPRSNFIEKSLVESERSDSFQPGKELKPI